MSNVARVLLPLAILLVLVVPGAADEAPPRPAVPAFEGPPGDEALVLLADMAVHEDEALARPAIDALRKLGPKGLEAFVARHGKGRLAPEAMVLLRIRPGAAPEIPEATAKQQAHLRRVRMAIDAIAAQKDAAAARLYWHTELAKAQTLSRETGKPILWLRLLGRLDEDLSCANSRFFRATLYPDPTVSTLLRERFVLCWESVRPAPRVTIDFGDGRVIEKTVTGNSAHHVLDAAGRPLGVLPGLHGAKAFTRWLKGMDALHGATHDKDDATRTAAIKRHHAEALLASFQTMQGLLGRFHMAFPTVDADAATATLATHHRLLLSAMGEPAATAGIWRAAADQLVEESALAPSVRAHIAATFRTSARAAGALAATKSIAEDPMIRQLRSLERTIAEDTARNALDLHPRAHLRFLRLGTGLTRTQLDQWVYAVLFQMPLDDPTLGLDTDAFDGLRRR